MLSTMLKTSPIAHAPHMMTSPSITYASPSDGHTPIGSPAPSQILLQRVASPNHLASQQTYVNSPRSVPSEYSQLQAPVEQQFDYEQNPELYANDDPHIYDFGPNGPLPVESRFVQPQIPQNAETNNLLFMSPAVQIQPPSPLHPQFASHLQSHDRNSMTPFSDAGSDYSIESSPELSNNHLIDISASGFAIPTSLYMPLPRSHPMQGRPYFDASVFEGNQYDSRSPSPSIREQVKRPLNAFMLYRKDKQAEIPTSNHQSVSRIIGAMWKNESADIKAKYNTLAQKERENHRRAYPGYKYSPKKRINKDKKVRRTMSQAAHVKRQEEERAILRAINKRSKSETTLARPLPEYLPLPKSKQPTVTSDDKPKSKTPVPEPAPRLIPHQVRSHSAQPPSQDYSKFTSNPHQQPSYHEEPEKVLAISQNIPVSSQYPAEQYESYLTYPEFPHLGQNGPESVDSPFDSETDSFSREFSTDPNLVCSPAPFTPFDESQVYGAFPSTQREDIEIFRMNSPFAADELQPKQDFVDARIHDTRVYAGQWSRESRESTVNPQDIMGPPDNC